MKKKITWIILLWGGLILSVYGSQPEDFVMEWVWNESEFVGQQTSSEFFYGEISFEDPLLRLPGGTGSGGSDTGSDTSSDDLNNTKNDAPLGDGLGFVALCSGMYLAIIVGRRLITRLHNGTRMTEKKQIITTL